MRHYINTDIEGVVGVDSFATTRESGEKRKEPAMKRLAREVNACIEGIRETDPEADVSVWDLHGSGGLHEEDVQGGSYYREGDSFREFDEADAVYFVGQHAMAGTAFAPLRHTYWSTGVDYFKLNGTFIGEFGARALVAGKHDVPTVFHAGDDKACHEAEIFVPEIETVSTKFGTGEESATHRNGDEVLDEIRETAARAATRIDEIPPLDGFEPPYELVVRYYDPVDDELVSNDGYERIDDRTIAIHGECLTDPGDNLYQRF